MSDPSAPQMMDLHDTIEVEIRDPEALEAIETDLPEEVASTLARDSPVALMSRSLDADDAIPSGIAETEDLPMEDTSPSEPVSAESQDQAKPMSDDVTELLSATEPTTESIEIDEEEVSFFVDTTPAPQEPSPPPEDDPFYVDIEPDQPTESSSKPLYRPDAGAAIGRRKAKSVSSDEEIVFAPRKYKQPQPIMLDMPQPQASSSKPTPRAEPTTVIDRAFAGPKHKPKGMSRAQKKAAKKDKKKGVGKKLRREKRQAERAVGSDIEWGSDGPPSGKPRADGLEMEGLSDSDQADEDDIAVLQDYLAGTLLNEKDGSPNDDSDEDSDSVVEELDSDEVDEAIEIDMMKQFGDDVSQWNQNGDIDAGSTDEEEEEEEEEEEGDGEGGSDSDASDWEDDSEDGTSDEDLGDEAIAQQMEEDIDRQLAKALEEGDSDDSEMEELFSGKAGWGNETDWFIQSMEVSHSFQSRSPNWVLTIQDALDSKAMTFKNRQKKSQSKLFHAIENGDFGDLELPTGMPG